MKQLFLPIISCLFLSALVEVHAQDNALFMVDNQKACLGTPIQITDLSTGGNGDVSYYYGDGTSSTPPNPNPTHTYTTASTFNLKQILPIAGTVIDPQTGNPVGYMSYTMAIKVVPNSKLSATYTLLDNTTINLFIYDDRFDSYDVDFGDGSGIVNVNHASSDTTTLNHIYPASIAYSLSIKGKFNTGSGCSSSDLSFSVTPLDEASGIYNPIPNALSTGLFVNANNSILPIRVDTIKAEANGLAYYFLETPLLENLSNGTLCLPNFSSLSGLKMIASGMNYYFYNKNNESIKLSPLNNENIPWTFYTYPNGDYVEAKVTLKEQVTFLGLTDSVKTISLQRKTSSNTNVSDPVNALTLKISKNYGFLQATSFIDFPNVSSSSQLIGLSDPQVGQQLLTTRKIYDFNIGDEFHYTKTHLNVPSDGTDYKIIRKVIDKYISANTDTVIYTLQVVKENIHYTFHQPPTPTTYDPATYTAYSYKEKHVVNDSIIYPGVYLKEENGNEIRKGYYYSLPPTFGEKMMLTIDYMYALVYHEPNHCWAYTTADGLYNYSSYVEGIGVSYFNGGEMLPSGEDSTLVYYKKGSDTYGQPIVLSTFSKSTEQALTLYPNPIKPGEELSFSALHFNATQLSLYNSSGNKIFESNIEKTDSPSIHLPKLQAGLYVVQLVNDKKEYITSKLVIQ